MLEHIQTTPKAKHDPPLNRCHRCKSVLSLQFAPIRTPSSIPYNRLNDTGESSPLRLRNGPLRPTRPRRLAAHDRHHRPPRRPPPPRVLGPPPRLRPRHPLRRLLLAQSRRRRPHRPLHRHASYPVRRPRTLRARDASPRPLVPPTSPGEYRFSNRNAIVPSSRFLSSTQLTPAVKIVKGRLQPAQSPQPNS